MFKGSNVALVTPFKNNQLDEENYIKLIHFHRKWHKWSGACWYNRWVPTLSHDEHQKVIELCVKESSKLPVIAGTGSNPQKKQFL